MPLSLAQMEALFSDNTAGDISAGDGRAIIQALYDWIPPIEKYKRGRLPGETAHAADDFFTTYSGYTEQAPTGVATWSATRGGLTCAFSGQTANDMCATLKPVPAAGVPITIETWFDDALSFTNNPGAGLVFTDGTLATSNIAGFGKLVSSTTGTYTLAQLTGTLTAVTAAVLTGSPRQWETDVGKNPMRLIWAAANTFAWTMSPDTENWTDFSKPDFSTTFTPTHMGLFATSWSSSETQVATFKYLRVYEADLSL